VRWFNTDLHCSVIEDVRSQFKTFGHTVESHLLSGHAWAMQRPRANKGTGEGHDGKIGYGSLNLQTWDSFFNDAPKFERTAAWQAENPQLDAFDGFISTYPPAFAMLYEGFRGRNIVNIPIRYELGFTHNPDGWREYNRRLVSGVDSGKISVVANSVYDAKYYEYFTGQKCHYITSLCDYIDNLAPKWHNPNGPVLAFGEHSGCRAAHAAVPEVKFVRDVYPEYSHAQIAQARALVWIPYTTSIMSFFEHYWLGMPMFVPSQKFLLDLFDQKLALSTFSWHQNPIGGSALPRVGSALPDPHTREGMIEWLDTYDFYNTAEFPFVTYFDSWADLSAKLFESRDYSGSVSRAMLAHNVARRDCALKQWAKVIAGERP
jgi:hypothetical protein